MFNMEMVTLGIKTMGMLLIVLALLVVVLRILRRIAYARADGKNGSLLKVIASLNLSQKDRIAVVDVYGEKIVVGISPGNISFLTRLESMQREPEDRHAEK